MIVLPNTDQLFAKLRAFILTIVPAGTEVIQGLDNRVPPPEGPYVVMTEILQQRLATNEAAYTDTGNPGPPEDQGTRAVQEQTQVDVQLDFYGDTAADNAKMVSKLLRDDYGCEQLQPVAAPLYADQARQMPYKTGEEQYNRRWTVLASLQYNPVTTLPQQFADAADVEVINVDERYPPT
jgi:hypothetical protein